MFEQFKNKFPLGEVKWAEYIGCFQSMQVPAKSILLREGELSKKVFFIEKGCMRAAFNNNGKNVTFQFFFENNTVASIESFRKEIPSLISIEAIEPCVVWFAHKKDMDVIFADISNNTAMREQFLDIIFERTFNYMKHFLSFIKDTPEQRYVDLINDKPQIVQRVPQHYIASYLGVSTVHLSRIKSKLARKKST